MSQQQNQNQKPKLVKQWGTFRLVQTGVKAFVLECAYTDALGETRWQKADLSSPRGQQFFFYQVAQQYDGEGERRGESREGV